jgi:hypothetical protein
MRPTARTLVLATALLLGKTAPISAQSPEYLAKIVLMDKMTRFVEWPTPAESDRAFVVGVIGRTPFGEALDDYFSKHSLKERPVVIRYYRQVQDLGDADLLFICASERPRLALVLERMKGRPTLTVADADGFVRAGVMVGFVTSGGKISFEVNTLSIRESGIRMRADFLRLAKVVP